MSAPSIKRPKTRSTNLRESPPPLLFAFSNEFHLSVATSLHQQALMGHELRFVLTPVGSSIAVRFAEQIRNTRAICMQAREQEVRVLEFCGQ